MRIKVDHQLLEFFHLHLQRFGRFEVFTFDCFSLPLIKHIQIAADEFKLICYVF